MSRRPGSAGAAAGRFARRLRERFRRCPVRAAVPMLVVRQRTRAIPVPPAPVRHLSARIAVSMPVHVHRPVRKVVHRAAPAGRTPRVVAATLPLRSTPAVATVVRDHVRHTAHVVRPTLRPVAVAGRVEQRVPPVQGTVLRATRPAGRSAAGTPVVRPTGVVVDAVGVEPRTPPGVAAGELDINRLTEQVVRRIDQRIVAQRERLGRR